MDTIYGEDGSSIESGGLPEAVSIRKAKQYVCFSFRLMLADEGGSCVLDEQISSLCFFERPRVVDGEDDQTRQGPDGTIQDERWRDTRASRALL